MIERIRVDEIPDATMSEALFGMKINEIIDVVNDLLLTHPRLKEAAEIRRSFEKEKET